MSKAIELDRAHRDLREKDRLLRMVETMSGVGHWHYEVKTGKVNWSDGMYQFFGMGPDAPPLSFEQFLEATVPEDRETVRQAVGKALACGGEYRLRRRVKVKNGEIRIIQSHAVCETAADGSVEAIFGVFSDITAIARAEEEARLNAFHLRHIIDAVSDHAIFMLDAKGNVTTWNNGAERLKGYTAEEIVGSHFSQFYTDEQRQDGLPNKLLATAASDGSAHSEEWRVRRDCSKFWASVSIHAMRGDDGELLGFAKVTRDLTARKQYEDELKDARESALVAAKAKSDFLSNMSHEIRTPLTSVVGFSNLLIEHGALNEQARMFASRIHDGGHALLVLINDILDFAKIESGQFVISPIEIDVTDIAGEVIGLLEIQAANKGLRLICDSHALDSGVKFNLDPARLRQILFNLVGNAVKFTDQGQVTLRIHTVPEEFGPTLRFEIEDTGPGISDDQKCHLFQRFSQLDTTATKQHSGTGLGLAICKGLVDAMGGRIGVSSTVGIGSKFWFTLPFEDRASRITTEAQSETLPATGASVLLVDDLEANRLLVRCSLASLGLKIDEAACGEEAIRLASCNSYDLVLMDIHMPGMDGISTMKAIKSSPAVQHGLFLAFTADADPNSIRSVLHEGFVDVVQKPLEVQKLRKIVSRLLPRFVEKEPEHAA